MNCTLSTYARFALPLLMIAAASCGDDDEGQDETGDGSTTAATESSGPDAGPTTGGPSTATTSSVGTDSEATTVSPTDGTVGTGSEATTISPTEGTTDGTDGTASSTASESSDGVKGVDPGPLSVMVANHSGVNVFTVEDGVATEAPGSPFEMNASITTMTMLGDQLFAAEFAQFSEDIFSFAFDGKTQSLSATAATSFNGMKRSGAAHPSMPVLYFTDTISETIGAFSVAGDGALTSIGADIEPGGWVSRVAVDPSGMHVYVTGFAGLSAFDVQPDGSLVETVGGQAAIDQPNNLAIDDADTCAYVATFEGVGVATLAADGVPSISPTMYDPRVFYRSVRTVPGGDADFVVLSNGFRTSTVRVDGPGACDLGTELSTLPFGEQLSGIEPVEGGYAAAVVHEAATQFRVFTIDTSGSLEEVDGSPFAMGNGATDVEIRAL